jgi:NADPH:quinone reductase-like Zn-dependent oxidoreductase
MTRQVRIHAFGAPEVLQIEEVNLAAPGPGEARLSIRAIGLNRTELTLRSGRSPVRPNLPATIGFEAAGVVEALGEGVTNVAIGDRVALVPAYGAAQYALYAEAANVPARTLVSIPDDMSFEAAAATWAAFGTAWGGLVHVGALHAGQSVLIPAASSGVGLAAIQIASRLGAQPIALTRTSAKVSALLAQGATAVVVTAELDLVAEIKRLTGGAGADLAFDPVGGPGFADLVRAVRASGMLVLFGALSPEPTVIPPFDIFARDLTIRGLSLVALARDDAVLAEMKAFVLSGLADATLSPAIARTYPLDAIIDAHRFLEAGEQVGKVVVTV